jgi:Ulp1 family protease
LNNSNDDEDEEAGKILTNLKRWIYDYSKNLIDMKMVKNEVCKTYEMWMSAEWKTELLQKIPRQKDSYNCGIFCLLYAYYIADNIEFNNKVCSASDLDNIRNKITKSILTNVLEKLN